MGKGNPHRRPAPARRIPNSELLWAGELPVDVIPPTLLTAISIARTRTRLQRPKLADPAQNSHDLALQLRSLGLYAASTLGDGNCLFRALCDQLYGSPKDHLILRREICDWMDAHRDHYQGFVEDGRTWEQHIGSMRQSGTYGGHLELSAFAHLKRRNVKVIQPGLVYVIEWSTGPNAAGSSTSVAPEPGPSTSTSLASMASSDVSTASLEGGPSSSREARRARRDRIREAKEAEKRKAAVERLAAIQPEVDGPDPDTLPAIYVAYHDWEHFSSVRNLTGPHQGIPNVVEAPAPPEDQPSPPSSSRRGKKNLRSLKPPSRSRSASPATTASTLTTTDVSSSTPSSAPPQTPPDSLIHPDTINAASAIFKSRSPKRSFDESEDALTGDGSGSDYGRKRSRGRRVMVDEADSDQLVVPPHPTPASTTLQSSATTDDEDDGEDEEEVVSTPDSSASRSASSLAIRHSPRLTKKPGQAPKPKPTPRRVILLVKGEKDKQKKSTTAKSESGKAEWMNNGTGKMDVRGFRELKI